jgi:hypothetical protein
MKHILALALLMTPAVAQEPCGLGHALTYDGSDDRVLVPYDNSFPTGVFTACGWIKALTPMSRGAVIARGEDDHSYDLTWALYVLHNGTFEVMIEDSNGVNHVYNSGAFVVDDTWRHVAATRDGSGTLTLYVDGQVRSVHTNSGVPSPDNQHDLSIGCSYGMIGPPPPNQPEPPIWFFRGSIDEVAMWGAALTPTQVQEVHAGGVDPASPNLRGYWKFDQGSGQAVTDLSPVGNDGFRGENPGADAADPAWVEQTTGISSFCATSPNTAGPGALLGASGSTGISQNDFRLEASGGVPGQPALFFYSANQQQVPFGEGLLCLGPGVFRLNPPTAFDASGDALRQVDFTQSPANAGAGQVLPGSTWSFQVWYRDPSGGSSGFNLSDGLQATFCQ